MKRKPLEAKPKRKKSELEISHAYRRALRQISEMAQVPLSRVFSDVMEIGIAAVVAQYKPMIEMEEERKGRAERIKRLFLGTFDTQDEPTPSEATGPRITAQELGMDIPEQRDSAAGEDVFIGSTFEPPAPERSDPAPEQPGFLSEALAATDGVEPDDLIQG